VARSRANGSHSPRLGLRNRTSIAGSNKTVPAATSFEPTARRKKLAAAHDPALAVAGEAAGSHGSPGFHRAVQVQARSARRENRAANSSALPTSSETD